jgi:hypothetical protein
MVIGSQALDQPHLPPAGLGSGMAPGPGERVVGHQGAGIPSRRRRRRSRPGVGSPARSARRVLQVDSLPQACSETSSPTRRDTRFRPPVLRQANSPRASTTRLTTVNGGACDPA